MREEKLIYEIKGKEYILLDRIFVGSNLKYYDEYPKSMIILGVIFKGYIEVVKAGWFEVITRVQYLVPIDKIREFDEIYKEMVEK